MQVLLCHCKIFFVVAYKNKRYEKKQQVKNIFEKLIERQRIVPCFAFMLLYIAYNYKINKWINTEILNRILNKPCPS